MYYARDAVKLMMVTLGGLMVLGLLQGQAISQTAEESSQGIHGTPGNTATPQEEGTAHPAAAATLDGNRQTVSPESFRVSERSDQEATLYIHNRPITVFRAKIYGDSPEERISDITKRINKIIRSGTPGDVSFQKTPIGLLFKIGEKGVFFITPEDLDPVSGETLQGKSEQAAKNLTEAIQAAMDQKSPEVILRGIIQSAVAVLFFVLGIWLIVRINSYICQKLDKIAAPRLDKMEIGGFRFFETTKLIALGNRVISLVSWLSGIFLLYICTVYILNRFPYTRPWGVASRGFVLGVLKTLAQGALLAIPNIFTVIVIIIITRFFVRLARLFFSAAESGRVSLPGLYPETARPTGRIFVVLLWAFSLVVIYPYLPGSGSAALKGLSVFAGVVISLGSTGITNQIMSGFVLMYSRALSTGDYVRIDETEGVVTAVGTLSTKIRNVKGEEITIPNLVVLGTSIKNYTRLAEAKGSLLYTTVSLGYSVPWRQVEALLKEAAERTEGLRHNPPPFVNQLELSDFYVKYQLNAYLVRTEDRVPVMSSLHANIQDLFNEHGVQIMSPHYEMDPPEKVWVPMEKWHGAPAEPEAESRQVDSEEKGNG
jgi:small-conductance mechanosensitive channel